jgi:hypothetical protein
MAAAGRNLLSGQVSDGCGKLDWNGAEADANGSVRLSSMWPTVRREITAGHLV